MEPGSTGPKSTRTSACEECWTAFPPAARKVRPGADSREGSALSFESRAGESGTDRPQTLRSPTYRICVNGDAGRTNVPRDLAADYVTQTTRSTTNEIPIRAHCLPDVGRHAGARTASGPSRRRAARPQPHDDGFGVPCRPPRADPRHADGNAANSARHERPRTVGAARQPDEGGDAHDLRPAGAKRRCQQHECPRRYAALDAGPLRHCVHGERGRQRRATGSAQGPDDLRHGRSDVYPAQEDVTDDGRADAELLAATAQGDG